MFRNQYDSDTTVWSPQGRLFQVEYAMEAVKQGTATVGLKSKDYVALVALCRLSKETNALQRKIMQLDSHLGMSFAGLTADARQVCQYLRTECMSYRHAYDAEFPVRRLVTQLGNKLQATTQRYDRRPYGVGMLVAGYDDQGTHVYQVMPSANVLSCKAMAIGSRSQSARTYLERHMDTFDECSLEDLICHGIQAVRGALGSEDSSNLTISVAIVGKGVPFKSLTETENKNYLSIAKKKGNPFTGEEDGQSMDAMSDDEMMDQEPSGSGVPQLDATDASPSGDELH
ncbi:hypothetical protein KR009_012262 [Drosophila setifemur]|nr:hypothetical protein KR009_012262 [Drosophila setifemur]